MDRDGSPAGHGGGLAPDPSPPRPPGRRRPPWPARRRPAPHQRQAQVPRRRARARPRLRRAATPTPTPTPSATTTEPPAVQRFTLDETAEFDDDLIVEIAGSVADKAKKTDKGAAATKGQIVIASVRLENGTKRTVRRSPGADHRDLWNGTAAEPIVDKTRQLQRGFSGKVKPNDESIATVAFAVPYTQLKRVTFLVDPNDAEHDPVSFTGRFHRL